jgi:phospholipase/carboxylesterase
MSGKHLSAVEIDPDGDIRSCVIWLHGLGADGHDFEPIVDQLDLPPEWGVRFVFPHAPHRPVTINGGFVMRAWYDIYGADLAEQVDQAGILQSVDAVRALVEREIERGIAPSRIILAGFSQGGAIALDLATSASRPLAGVIALSTYIAIPARVAIAAWPMPVFIGHGTQDPIVPLGLSRESRKFLEEKGYRVEWHDYPMPHSVCPEELMHIRRWLLACWTGSDALG